MISRWIVALCIAFTFALAGLGAAFSTPSRANAPVRNFEFTYLTSIPALPLGAKTLRIWIPLPQSDPYQAIGGLKIESPFPYVKHRDPEYGNEYVYLQVSAAQVSSIKEVRMSSQVTRQEHRVELDAHPVSAPSAAVDSHGLRRFLEPDRRVPLQGVIAELAAQETRGIQDPLEKARAIYNYNYVVATMRYDKSGCSSPICCARHEKDFFLLSASSSVWNCRLIRRPAKDTRRKSELCLGRVTRRGAWSSENSSGVYAATA